MKAIWKNTTIAESEDTIVIENNHYFPADSIKKEFFKTTETHTHCPWKGEAPIIPLSWLGRKIKMQPGIIQVLNMRQRPLPTTWPFGKGFPSWNKHKKTGSKAVP